MSELHQLWIAWINSPRLWAQIVLAIPVIVWLGTIVGVFLAMKINPID